MSAIIRSLTAGRERAAVTDDMLDTWYARSQRRKARQSLAPHARRRSMVGDGRNSSSDKLNSTTQLAALALHGAVPLVSSDKTYVQHLSSATVRAVPPDKLDGVSFTWPDRFSAWMSGMGRELYLLKMAHVETPGEKPSRVQRVRQRSLVLMGGEEQVCATRSTRPREGTALCDDLCLRRACL